MATDRRIRPPPLGIVDERRYNAVVRSDSEVLFEALTPLGFRVLVTHERWNLITTVKHPVMLGRESSVKATLTNPSGFLITAYPTDAIKEGTRIWPN